MGRLRGRALAVSRGVGHSVTPNALARQLWHLLPARIRATSAMQALKHVHVGPIACPVRSSSPFRQVCRASRESPCG